MSRPDSPPRHAPARPARRARVLRAATAVCFTMLHHVPSSAAQDRLFAEAKRVLGRGGLFAGSDSRAGARFRLLHLRDTMVVVDPHSLPGRLQAAGFIDPLVQTDARSFRFRATTASSPW